MVFHESLNQERKFSLAIPLVFIAILGGTTGTVAVATVLSPNASYAVNTRSQLAATASEADESDKQCPKETRTEKYGTKSKLPVYAENDVLITNLSWRKCQHTEDTDIAAQGYCIGENICHADICDEKQCTLTKVPGGGTGDTGTGEPPKTLRTVEELQELKDQSQQYGTVAKLIERDYNERVAGCAGDPSCLDNQADTLNSLNQRRELYQAASDDAWKQLQSYGSSPAALTDDGVGAYNVPLDKSFTEKSVGLTPEQQESADLNKVWNYSGVPGASPDTFGPAATPEELKRAELENTIRSDQAAWDAANRQAALEETIRSDQAAWAGANHQAALEETIRSDQAAWAAADKQAALDRDARIQELKNAEAGANAGTNEFSAAQRKELDELTGRNAPADPTMDWYNSLSDKDKKALSDNYGEDIRAAYDAKLQADAEAKGGKTRGLGDVTTEPAPKTGDGADTGDKGEVSKKKEPSVFVERKNEKGQIESCDQYGTCKKPAAPAPKAPVDPTSGQGGPEKAGAADNTKNGAGSGLGSALSSMLQGLMKALGAPQPTPPAPSQPCSTDPNIFAQQQQQYQQQLQQYNYQLQQQQYQQQMNQFYADRNGTTPPPVQPLPAQPSACTPSTGSQCQSQPQQPAASSCTSGWRPVYSGSCITNWTCPTTGDAPTATLSCEPDLADVGQTLALTYNCSSGVASSSAFKVTTQPGGSATTTVKRPPQGTNTATYTLACTDNGKTTGAQCSVKVNRPNIFLVTNPQTVAPGEISLISWLTTGMDSCVISSPDQPDFTQRNSSNTSVTGAATSSPIASSTAMFQLDCITLGGMDKQATTSVSVVE